jgi:hypothetical protein
MNINDHQVSKMAKKKFGKHASTFNLQSASWMKGEIQHFRNGIKKKHTIQNGRGRRRNCFEDTRRAEDNVTKIQVQWERRNIQVLKAVIMKTVFGVRSQVT